MALDALAESSRRSRDYAGATQALRQKIDHYSAADTVEGAMDLAMLAEALGEEAFHLQPDYAAATARLTEALGLYMRAMAIYASIDRQDGRPHCGDPVRHQRVRPRTLMLCGRRDSQPPTSDVWTDSNQATSN